jgi:TolB-like protein
VRIFLSYGRADRERIEPLAAALSALGHEVWWDRQIVGGSAFAQEIEKRLAEADRIVVAWSAASIGSDWVRDEAAVGRDRGVLVPLQLDATPSPLGFRQYQTVDLSRWRGDADAPEIAALQAALGGDSLPPRPAPVRERRARRWLSYAAAGLAAVFLAAGAVVLGPKLPHMGKAVVAVLPFDDAAGGKTTAYFAEGLAEEILDTLAQDSRLKVLGAITARAIRDNSANPNFARDKLGVTRVLEGSVRGGADANAVKVSVRLIDTADGSEIWGQTFDRSGADIAAVQSEVAHAVASRLAGTLNAPLPNTPAARAPAAAYEKLVVARQLIRTRQKDASLHALSLADQAVALAPDYAPAYAVRSRAKVLAFEYNALPRDAIGDARRDAETATRLDPRLSEGFTAASVVWADMGDSGRALAAASRALALSPNDPEAQYLLGVAYFGDGDTNRAIDALEKYVATDPLWPKAFLWLFRAYSDANQTQKIRLAAQRFRAVAPDLADADLVDVYAASCTGEFGRAVRLADSALARNPQMTQAREFQLVSLGEMYAFDHISDDLWRLLPALYRQAFTGNWQDAVNTAMEGGPGFWSGQNDRSVVSYTLMQLNRPADLIRAFNARFRDVSAYLADPSAEADTALTLSAAFERLGRAPDARALRDFARTRMTLHQAHGAVAATNALNWAKLRLAEGDRAGALATLEEGVAAAWWRVCSGPIWLGDNWSLAPLRGDPRFEAVKGRCRVEINAQRKAAGIGPADLN